MTTTKILVKKQRKVYLCLQKWNDEVTSKYNQQKNYNNSNLKLDKYLDSFFKQKKWFKHTREWMNNKTNIQFFT